jgi:hypothetical protein
MVGAIVGSAAHHARGALLEAAWVRVMHLAASISTGTPWVESVADEVRRRRAILDDELAALESVGDDLARGRLTP